MRFLTTLLLLLSALPLYCQTAPAVRKSTAVQTVTLTNDSIVSSENLQEAVRSIQRNFYGPNAEARIAGIARGALHDQGYFKAQVETVATQVLNETARTRAVAVTLRIHEGERYRVARITFAKNKVFSDARLRQELPIKDGDVMSDQKIREGIDNLRHLYASKGYMEVAPVPEIAADDASRTLSITMDVDEGPQFTVNGLTLEGDREWPADKAAKLQSLASTYSGSHNVSGFIDEVKRVMAEMFPDYPQIDSLVGVTMGGEQPRVTANVTFPGVDPK